MNKRTFVISDKKRILQEISNSVFYIRIADFYLVRKRICRMYKHCIMRKNRV